MPEKLQEPFPVVARRPCALPDEQVEDLVRVHGPQDVDRAIEVHAVAERGGRPGRQQVPEVRPAVSLALRPFAADVGIGIPFAVAAIGAVALVVAGVMDWTGLGTISAIEVVIFVLVIGEEIGWRGFLQPRLRARMGLLESGLVTGGVWVLWHLPIYLQPGTPLSDYAIFAWWVIPLAVVMGFIAERAQYSVIVATVMHGAANIATPILLPGVDSQTVQLVTGTIYVILASALVVRSRAHRPVAGAIVRQARVGAAT